MRQIAEATHICGDPGLQFDTTVNDWHTCPNTARINASNPCSEYMFLDDSACNLASINLMRFLREDGEIDAVAFEAACRTMITAQEILVDNSSYPTPAIAKNSHDYRPLGLGYANLGALLMSRGLPYDGDSGRDYAAAITALMHGAAFAQSAKIARDHGGPFAGLREEPRAVPARHAEAPRGAQGHRSDAPADRPLRRRRRPCGTRSSSSASSHGFRNAQATVLAPTGTIGFMMDCDTTGVEPDIALVKYKKLVGGGLMKIVNQTVPLALTKLGYTHAAGQGDRRVHRRERDHRRRAAHQGQPPAGVRLRVQAGARRPVDSLHGPRPHDGGGAAVPLRGDFQDGERPEGSHASRRSSRPTSTRGAWARRRCRFTGTAASGRSR